MTVEVNKFFFRVHILPCIFHLIIIVDVVMVKSSNYQCVYKLVQGLIHHGRNVWKSVDSKFFLYFGGKYWLIGSDYKKVEAWMASLETDLEKFPSSNWTYPPDPTVQSKSNDSCCWTVDDSFAIEPYNPDMLVVVSDGDAASIHNVKMGIYTKIKGMSINGNSVWAHASGKQFIYFMDNVWKIGVDYYDSNAQ